MAIPKWLTLEAVPALACTAAGLLALAVDITIAAADLQTLPDAQRTLYESEAVALMGTQVLLCPVWFAQSRNAST